MPTYVYRRADGTTFEVSQKISDPKLTEDPETGQPVERVISGGAGLQFKGSGFYLTDYARAGTDAKSGSGSKGPGAPSGDSSSKTDGASAPAPATKESSSSSSGASDD